MKLLSTFLIICTYRVKVIPKIYQFSLQAHQAEDIQIIESAEDCKVTTAAHKECELVIALWLIVCGHFAEFSGGRSGEEMERLWSAKVLKPRCLSSKVVCFMWRKAEQLLAAVERHRRLM
jgi:hypothetical protein